MNDVSPPPVPATRSAEPRSSKKTVIRRRWSGLVALVGVVAVAAGGYTFWRWPDAWQRLFGPEVSANLIVVSGNIEAHESVLSFTQVQAPIVYLPFDEGAYVERGTVLAQLDDHLYQKQVEIDRTNLDVVGAQVAANQSSLAAAQNSVVNDQFDLSEKQQRASRYDGLIAVLLTAALSAFARPSSTARLCSSATGRRPIELCLRATFISGPAPRESWSAECAVLSAEMRA